MTRFVDTDTGRVAPVFLIPLGIALLLTAGTQMLPETDFFDFLRGMAIGLLTAIAFFTVVGLVAARRRATLRVETRTLDDLEPLGPGGGNRRPSRSTDRTEKPAKPAKPAKPVSADEDSTDDRSDTAR